MNIWEDLTVSCPLCGAKPSEQCIGIQGSARFVIHESRIAKNQMEYTRRLSLYPEMLAMLIRLKPLVAWQFGVRPTVDELKALIAKCESEAKHG